MGVSRGRIQLGFLGAAAVAVLAASALAPVAALAAARPKPTMTISPATGLADGQYVKVSLANFPKRSGIGFRQCVASASNVATDCTALSTVEAVTDATGAASTYLPVYANADTALQNSGGTGTITCDASHACEVAAVREATDLVGAVIVPIAFAPAPSDCPTPGTNSILGSGAATAYRAIYGWEASVCQPPASLAVGYTVSNSVDGMSNFLNGTTDYGVSGPLPASAVSNPKHIAFRYAPITLSGLVLAFRMYDLRGPQITSITLTPDLIAQIYEGLIPNWSTNAEITALNPGVDFPPRIVPYARAEHSAETYTFTSWLSDTTSVVNPTTGQRVWSAGPQTIFPPPPSQVVEVTGSDGMGRAVVNPLTNWFNQGNIGFMDSSTAAFYGLSTVQIKRADGSVTAATPATLAAAAKDATTNADGTITPDYATTDPAAYPMPIPTYLAAPTTFTTSGKAQILSSFIKYAVQAGQTNLPAGYAPLPPSLVTDSLNIAAGITTATPSPSPSPSPKASPTPTVSAGGAFGSGTGTSTTSGFGGSAASGGTSFSSPAVTGSGFKSTLTSFPCVVAPAAAGVKATSSASHPGAKLARCAPAAARPVAHTVRAAAALLAATASSFVLPAIVGLLVLSALAAIALQVLLRVVPESPAVAETA